jgi:hypothetical protein
MESVYLETTFFNYLVSNPSRDLVVAAHQQTTHDWWGSKRASFECFASPVVIQEAKAGDLTESRKRLEILGELPLLDATNEAERLAAAILSSGILPPKAALDAAHVSLATVHRIDFLLTWNCRHLANAHIMRQLSRFCVGQGYELPVICTPEELLEDSSDD